MEDELIDDFGGLTARDVDAKILAKKLGGQLAVWFVFVVFIACLSITILSDGDTAFIIGTIGSFFVSAGAAFYLLIISIVAGCTGGIVQSIVDQFMSVNPLDVFAFALISLFAGFVPSLFLGWIYGLILNSYRSRFHYVDEEE